MKPGFTQSSGFSSRPRRKIGLFLLAGALLGLLSSAQAVEIPEAWLTEKVSAHVTEKLSQWASATQGAEISVRVLHIPGYGPERRLDLPAARELQDVAVDLQSSLETYYANRTVVRTHVRSRESLPEGPGRDLAIPVEITVRKPVWIVKEPIIAGQALRPADFTLETRDVSRSLTYAVGQERNLKHYLARVNLRPGDMLDARKLLLPPDVAQFSDIRIILAHTNGMRITVPGVALENGRIGQNIRVRYQQNKNRYYTARVIQRNQVLVEM